MNIGKCLLPVECWWEEGNVECTLKLRLSNSQVYQLATVYAMTRSMGLCFTAHVTGVGKIAAGIGAGPFDRGRDGEKLFADLMTCKLEAQALAFAQLGIKEAK